MSHKVFIVLYSRFLFAVIERNEIWNQTFMCIFKSLWSEIQWERCCKVFLYLNFPSYISSRWVCNTKICMFMFSRIPGKTYMIIAFLTVGTMGLSNTSLGYLNYPTQVIFKCCKLIPVMIGGVFIQGKC